MGVYILHDKKIWMSIPSRGTMVSGYVYYAMHCWCDVVQSKQSRDVLFKTKLPSENPTKCLYCICYSLNMWASRARTYLPYIATGAIATTTTFVILRKYSQGKQDL